MGSCELCGREDNLSRAVVEGSMLNVCSFCVKFGHVIEIKPKNVTKEEAESFPWNKKSAPRFSNADAAEGIVDDFPALVRKAREKKELTQEKLGHAIGERESVIQKIESGNIAPNLKTAKKLEVFLGIKLITKNREGPKETKSHENLDFRDSSLTIGDMLGAAKDKQRF